MKPSYCIMGIDPGVSGAISFYFPEHPHMVSAIDVPVVAGKIDSVSLAVRIAQMNPDLAIIECVGPMPKQGVSSTFNFGVSFGAVLGVVAAMKIPSRLVTPSKWKKHFALSADKEASRALALRLWPGRSELFARKKDHGRAEAALLARYGAETDSTLPDASARGGGGEGNQNPSLTAA